MKGGGLSPRIINLGNRQRNVSLSPQMVYHRGKNFHTHLGGRGSMGPKALLDKVDERKIRTPARNPIPVSRSSHSVVQSLYHLSYPSSDVEERRMV